MKTFSLSKQSLAPFTEAFEEPAWLYELRCESWNRYEALLKERDLPSWFTEAQQAELIWPPAVRREKIAWQQWPSDLYHTLEERGDEDGLLVQRDTELLARSISKEPAKKGVIFSDLSNQVRATPERFRAVFEADAKSSHLDVLLTNAFWGRGAYLFVPAHQHLVLPLHACFWLSRSHRAMFPRIIVQAEKGSTVTFVQEFISPDGPSALLSGLIDVTLAAGANVNCYTLSNLGAGTGSQVRMRVSAETGARWNEYRYLSGQAQGVWYDEVSGAGSVSLRSVEFNETQTTFLSQSDSMEPPVQREVLSTEAMSKTILDPSMREKMRLYTEGKLTGARAHFSLHQVSLFHPENRV